MSEQSPLTQVSPTSLEDLFNTDPDLFEGPDDPRVVQIVEALRIDRARWLAAEAAGKKPKKTEAPPDLSFGDLQL